MFGYIRPQKSEMLMREFSRFRSVYCGICKEIGREYGQIPRITLTYDITMLGVLMISLSDDSCEEELTTCILNPIQKKAVIKKNDAISRCAALSVILAYGKFLDEIQDGSPVVGNIGKGLLYSASQKAAKLFPKDYITITKGLESLEILQKKHYKTINDKFEDGKVNNKKSEHETEFAKINSDLNNGKENGIYDFYKDEAAIFGEILGNVFANSFEYYFNDDPHKKNLIDAIKLLGENMGKWIFIVDCIDDLEKDQKNNSWNPLKYFDESKAHEVAMETLAEYEKQMDQIAALLPYKRDAGIISNIIQLGLLSVRGKVFSKQKLGRL